MRSFLSLIRRTSWPACNWAVKCVTFVCRMCQAACARIQLFSHLMHTLLCTVSLSCHVWSCPLSCHVMSGSVFSALLSFLSFPFLFPAFPFCFLLSTISFVLSWFVFLVCFRSYALLSLLSISLCCCCFSNAIFISINSMLSAFFFWCMNISFVLRYSFPRSATLKSLTEGMWCPCLSVSHSSSNTDSRFRFKPNFTKFFRFLAFFRIALLYFCFRRASLVTVDHFLCPLTVAARVLNLSRCIPNRSIPSYFIPSAMIFWYTFSLR